MAFLKRSSEPVQTRSGSASRIAVSTVFFLNGAVFGSWVTRIPAVKDEVGASESTLGLALLCLAIGSLLAMPVTGPLVDRWGSARITFILAMATSVASALPGLAGDVVALGLVLGVYGAAFGALDVAMNVAAVEVIDRVGRPIMPSFHAAFSLGGLTGAATGALAAGAGLSVTTHLSAVAAVSIAVVLVVARWLPRRAVRLHDSTERLVDERPVASPPSVLRRPATWIFGAVAFCAAFSEGAIADWATLFLRDHAGATAAVAALGYASFSVAMTVMRLLGHKVLERWGRARSVSGGFLLASAGIASCVVAPQPGLVLVGLAVAGLGLAVAFPVAMEGGGEIIEGAAGRGVSAVSTIGYTGFLLGPVLIGFLADATSLRLALLAVVALTILGALAGARAPRTRARATRPSPPLVRQECGRVAG